MADDQEQFYEPAIYGLPIRNPDGQAHGREPFEVLASEYIEAVREGRNPRLEDYTAKYPDLAEKITELFPLLAAMEGWKTFRARNSLEHRAIGILSSERFGNFRILRELGRGSMGIVFEAEEQSSHTRVAIKVLPYLTTNELRDRFEREARIAARLRHPNIVPVSTFGEFDGLFYYVMQLVRGVGLDWVISQLSGGRGLVTPAEILDHFAAGGEISIDDRSEEFPADESQGANNNTSASSKGTSSSELQDSTIAEGINRDSWALLAGIGAQIAAALEYAHACGTLHRDIKPANVLLDASGRAWLTDFGLAKRTSELMEDAETHPAGTLRYIAPEQFSGFVDARSDVYSLGVTLFELLTRTSAFAAEDRQGLLQMVMNSPLPRIRERNRWVPSDLDAIVARATAKNPSQRYPTAGALKDDLVRFLSGQRVHARGIRGWLPFSK